MKTRCLIVDDEPLARQVLKKHIETLPSLELVRICANAAEAAAFLHENEVGILFLDIQMPGLSGMEFLKTLAHPPQVIITTAFSEYALEGYEQAVTDYLLKPIPLDRFVQAVNKAMDRLQAPRASARGESAERREDFVFLREDKTEHKVRFAAIRYLEGAGNFVKVFTDHGMILTPATLTALAEHLPANRFLRVHKSFIVAKERIDRIRGNTMEVGKDPVPIGKYYKKDVERFKAAHRLKDDT